MLAHLGFGFEPEHNTPYTTAAPRYLILNTEIQNIYIPEGEVTYLVPSNHPRMRGVFLQ